MSTVTVDVIMYCEYQMYLLQGCCTGNTNAQKIGENNGLWRCRRCMLFKYLKEIPGRSSPVLSSRYKAFSQPRVLFNGMFSVTFS